MGRHQQPYGGALGCGVSDTSERGALRQSLERTHSLTDLANAATCCAASMKEYIA
jgi:hypothetical protein